MNIKKAMQREEKRLVKQANNIKRQLSALRSALQALGGRARGRRRKFSKATRAKMAASQKRRWAAKRGAKAKAATA